MYLRIFILFSLISYAGIVHAVHLVGGVISYEHLSGTQYEVTLKVYRDCAGGGAAFDGTPNSDGAAYLGVFNGDNEYQYTADFPPPLITNIDASLTGICGSVNIPACVQEGVYVYTINLPANSSGYKLVYQRCCRNGTVQNIVTPGDVGNTFECYVPPLSEFEVNSSPVFNNFPPVALCLDHPLEFDHSATDLDGDELVYSFCTPFSGASSSIPHPFVPSSPEYNTITWAAGFSEEYQIVSTPAFAINSQTGLLTGTPTQQGQYVIGICVKEYRDGEYISETRRDFQFNVLLCPGQPLAGFAESSSANDCATTVDFENNSQNSFDYFWDFGDGSTSIEEEPSHTYEMGGTYEVLLVTYGNNGCSDSTFATITLVGVPNPVLNDLGFECINDEEFYSISISELDLTGETYSWSLDGTPSFTDATTMVNNINDLEVGEHTIAITVTNDEGCSGVDEVLFTINPSPVPNFSSNAGPCTGIMVTFNNQSTGAVNFEWDFDFSSSNSSINQDEVTIDFPSSGSYNVSITASGDQVCTRTYEEVITVSPNVFASLEFPEPQCQVGNASSFIPVGSFATPATYLWEIEDGVNIDSMAASQIGISVSQEGNHLVQLSIVDDNNCEISVSGNFLTIDPLVVSFETEGDGCLPYAAYFDNTSTGGYGLEVEWDFGDGQTSTAFAPYHTYNSEGIFDVSLSINATIGCIESGSYTLNEAVATFPSPEAGFTVEPLEVSIFDPEITVASTVDSGSCSYFISDGGDSEECVFNYIFEDAGLYEITQFTTNEYGCSNSTLQTVRVNGHLFYAPNAITMNEDGLNDFFKPHILGDIVEYDFTLFNRWGETIFHTQDPDSYWRPEYSHDGVYFYVIRLRDSFNTAVIYEGSFISVR